MKNNKQNVTISVDRKIMYNNYTHIKENAKILPVKIFNPIIVNNVYGSYASYEELSNIDQEKYMSFTIFGYVRYFNKNKRIQKKWHKRYSWFNILLVSKEELNKLDLNPDEDTCTIVYQEGE